MTAVGVCSYGVYLPVWRLHRQDIGGSGTRSVAAHDEDSTSMGVGAAIDAPGDTAPRGLLFATATPAYADKTNATVLHAALGLDRSVAAHDVGGAARSGTGALIAAADAAAAGRPTLAVLSDVRTGLPGSADERDGGDGAAAVLFGTGDDVVAELVGHGSASAEFLDRWRVPGDASSHLWEERFAVDTYVALARDAVAAAGVDLTEIDRVGVAGLHGRAVRTVRASFAHKEVPDWAGIIGATGTAEPGVMLATALDDAGPGETILLLHLADGADALVFRTTSALDRWRRARVGQAVSKLAAGGRAVDYQRYLTWRGFLRREPPRRPDPDRPAAPPAARNAAWKFGLTGTRCAACGTRHLPPVRVCRNCHRVDEMTPDRVAGERGVIAGFQADLLAHTLNPPLIGAAVDFAGGGRLMCEITDADPATLRVGDPVEMTFRRLHTTADGVHNYFWKARPCPDPVSEA